MNIRSVITLTTAPAGSGKSYRRCAHFLSEEWLPEHDGVHHSNFPINIGPLTEYVGKQWGRDPADLAERVQIIPEQVVDSWKDGRSGPWEYFDRIDLNGAHIAIDECHVFCGKTTDKKIKNKWQSWLGEIRHRGATVEFISQSPNKIATEIINEASVKVQLVNSEHRRDPICKILLGDWYELRAGFITGRYRTTIWELESREAAGKWIVEDKRVFPLDPKYFAFYDSYSRPHGGGVKGRVQLREFERRSRMGLAFWFLNRNALRLFTRLALVALAVWLTFFGGGKVLMGDLLAGITSATAQAATVDTPGVVHKQTPHAHADAALTPEQLRDRLMEADARLMAQTDAMTQMSADLASCRAGLDAITAELERAAAVELIGPDSLTFRNGYTYSLGELIDFGPYKGRSVASVDLLRRRVLLDDGTALRMGRRDAARSDGGGWVRDGAAGLVESAGTSIRPDLSGVGGGR